MDAGTIKALLFQRLDKPEWFVQEEVTLAGRRIDVAAFNLWGARKWRVEAYEIKVSRADWLRELSDHRKSEEWAAVVDGFYVVAPKGIVEREELPEGWGYIEATAKRLLLKVHARLADTSARPMPRELVARLLTRARDELRGERDRNKRLQAMRRDGRSPDDHWERAAKQAWGDSENLRREVSQLRNAMGLTAYEDLKLVGELLRAHRTSEAARSHIRRCADDVSRTLEVLTERIASLDRQHVAGAA